MRRAIATTVAFATLVLAFAACDDGRWDHGPRGDYCGQYSSCDTCTPVLGCGWCQAPSGEGACVSDPNACAGAAEFSWTWEPTGCRTPADAGVTARDGGADAPGEAAADAGNDAVVK